LPSLDFKLPLPDFPNLPDLNVPAPFNQIVPIDLSDLLDEVKFGNLDFESVINVIKPAFVSTKIFSFILFNQHFSNF